MQKGLHVGDNDFEFRRQGVELLPVPKKTFEFFCQMAVLLDEEAEIQIRPARFIKRGLAHQPGSRIQHLGNHRPAGINGSRLHHDGEVAEHLGKTRRGARINKSKTATWRVTRDNAPRNLTPSTI